MKVSCWEYMKMPLLEITEKPVAKSCTKQKENANQMCPERFRFLKGYRLSAIPFQSLSWKFAALLSHGLLSLQIHCLHIRHTEAAGFIQAASKEHGDLERRGTWISVKRPTKADVVPAMWVFTYKFDFNGYLINYKARLVVRGDLFKSIYEDTYSATLRLPLLSQVVRDGLSVLTL